MRQQGQEKRKGWVISQNLKERNFLSKRHSREDSDGCLSLISLTHLPSCDKTASRRAPQRGEWQDVVAEHDCRPNEVCNHDQSDLKQEKREIESQ